MPLSSNHSRSINYQLLLNGFLSSPTRPRSSGLPDSACKEHWRSLIQGRPADRTEHPAGCWKNTATWWPIPSRKSWMPPTLNSVFLPSGKWLTWPPSPKRNQWLTSKRNWDRYPWPPVFLKWRKSSSWMVSWNLRSWTSSMTTSTEPSQIPQLQRR